MDLQAEIVKGLIMAMVAAGAAYVGSTRGFVSQRWWERKAEAYNQIIEALVGIVQYHEHFVDDIEQSRDTPDDEWGDLVDILGEGMWRVQHACYMGAYFISDAAVSALNVFINDKTPVVDPSDLYEIARKDYTSAKRCLDDITEEAKRDLRVSWKSLLPWRV